MGPESFKMSQLLPFSALFAVFILINGTNGFLPNRFHDNEDSNKFGTSYTYRDITKVGLQRAALSFIKKKFNTAITSVSEHFGEDHQARRLFDAVVDNIIDAGSDIAQHRNKTAHYHMMGEQIQLGHYHLLWLRNRITTISQSTSPDYPLIRKLIGEYLYTMQSFYSNTNWVEVKGKTVNVNLGTTGSIDAVAKTNVSMCKDCDDSEAKVKEDSCKENLIKKTPFLLTSSYKYGQDMHKPLGFLSKTEGKCSYGGKNDGNSSDIPGKGGINKDTNSPAYSPHYKFHADAAETAMQATEHFFVDEQKGLLQSLTSTIMQNILQIWPKGPIIFIVDVTQGMNTHMKDIKTPLTDNLKNLLEEYKPPKYIVANITDKDDTSGNNVQGANSTSDVADAVDWLKKLPSVGGGDSYEHPFTAIETTLKRSDAGKMAKVFVLTDSGAHDRNMSSNVTKLAKSKSARIDFIYFGFVQDRRRRDVNEVNTGNSYVVRKRRAAATELSVYRGLCTSTGGTAFPKPGNEIADILEVVETEFWPNAPVDVVIRNMTTACEVSFPVDNYVRYVRIHLDGVASGKTITLKDHRASTYDFKKDSKASKIYIGEKKYIVQVKQPAAGSMWSISAADTEGCYIKVTGHSGLDFTYYFVKHEAGAMSYPIRGSPVVGNSYSLVVSVNNLKEGKVNNIITLDTNGATIQTLAAKKFNSTSETLFHAKVSIPNKKFYVSIDGTDSRGSRFRRISSSKIEPSDVTFTVLSYHGDLAPNKDLKLKYKLENLAEGGEYRVEIKNDRKLRITPDSKIYDLSKGQTESKDFWITGGTANQIVKVNFTVTKTSTSAVHQFHEEMFWTTAAGLPSCSIKSSGSCASNVMFTTNCSSKTWSAKANVNVQTGTVKAAFASNADSYNVTVSQDSWAAGTAVYSIKGSCCNPVVYLNIISEDGGFAQCKFEQAGGKTLNYTVNAAEESAISDMEVLIIAIGIPVGFLLLIAFGVLIIWCRVKKNTGNDFDLSFEYK